MSHEKSKNVLEEKRKNSQAKNLHKKDQHVYNNCYELRSRAINNQRNIGPLLYPTEEKTGQQIAGTAAKD